MFEVEESTKCTAGDRLSFHKPLIYATELSRVRAEQATPPSALAYICLPRVRFTEHTPLGRHRGSMRAAHLRRGVGHTSPQMDCHERTPCGQTAPFNRRAWQNGARRRRGGRYNTALSIGRSSIAHNNYARVAMNTPHGRIPAATHWPLARPHPQISRHVYNQSQKHPAGNSRGNLEAAQCQFEFRVSVAESRFGGLVRQELVGRKTSRHQRRPYRRIGMYRE